MSETEFPDGRTCKHISSTLPTSIWYAKEDAGLDMFIVQQLTMTRMQLGKCGMDQQMQRL